VVLKIYEEWSDSVHDDTIKCNFLNGISSVNCRWQVVGLLFLILLLLFLLLPPMEPDSILDNASHTRSCLWFNAIVFPRKNFFLCEMNFHK